MRIALAVALACLGALLSPRPATAATLTWTGNGGSGDWNDADNWDSATIPVDGDALIFAGVNQLALNDNLGFSGSFSLTFDNTAGAFTLGGGSRIANGITNSSANLQTVSTPVDIRISQTWDAGSGGLAITDDILFSNSGSATLTLTGSGDTLVSGVIDELGFLDVGSLVKTGGGVLTLSGANNYRGGTAINGGTVRVGSNGNLGAAAGILSFDGGTLQTTASFTTTRATTLNAGGGVFNTDSATTLTHGGVISGSGGLTKSGAGTLTLTGANTYTGGTTVSAGTLQGDATSLQGNIVNNAAVVFDQAADGTYAGAMSGSGSLAKSGAGTLTLSGANSYSGGTTVSAGTLQGDAVSLQGAIVNNAAVVFDQAIDGTYAGTMSGGGSLAKSGGGTLTLSGVNTYTGGTTVSAGTLQGDASSLQGNIANNATVVFDQAIDGTYAGAMSGGGSLTKSGAGTLTLSGANAYTGATAVDAGTLRAGAANVFGNGSALTVAAGAVLDLNGFNQTLGSLAGGGDVDLGAATLTAGGDNSSTAFSGAMSGSGALVKTGTGTLTLSGANTYSGGTTVDAGTLQGDATSLQGAIVNNAAVVFDQSADGTYAGAMSGSGTLTKSGTGTLTLSGANSYSGGTTVSAGTLQGDAASLQGAIANNATVVFDQAIDGTYAGAMSGSGGLVKSGAGKLVLSGSNTYSGDTRIDAGILSVNGSVASDVVVDSGGTLGGSGTIGGNVTVADGGTLAPGNSPGILTMDSLTLSSGSVTRMEINGTTAGSEYDRIVVTGTATLGGTLELVFGYSPSVGDRFSLIQAGSIVPGFASIADNISANFGAALRLDTIIGATTLDVVVDQGSFVPFGLTGNARSVAATLDSQYAAWGVSRLIERLDTLNATDLSAALNRLSGEQHTLGQSLVRRLGTQFDTLLLSRLNNTDSQLGQGWNFWLKGLGGFGRVEGDGNAGGANNHSGGFVLGADTALGPQAVLGAAFGYVRSNLDAVAASFGVNSYQFASYAKWHQGQDYLKGTLGAGFHHTDASRLAYADYAASRYDSTTAGAALEAGHDIALPGQATLTPYAGMRYLHLNREGFRESGTDLANLAVRQADENSFRTQLGARLSQAVKTDLGVTLQPSLHAAWVREHGDSHSRLAADFAAAPSITYRADGPKLHRNRAAVGAGLAAHFNDAAQLNVAYDAELAGSDNWHAFSATFQYRW